MGEKKYPNRLPRPVSFKIKDLIERHGAKGDDGYFAYHSPVTSDVDMARIASETLGQEFTTATIAGVRSDAELMMREPLKKVSTAVEQELREQIVELSKQIVDARKREDSLRHTVHDIAERLIKLEKARPAQPSNLFLPHPLSGGGDKAAGQA